MRRMTVAAVTFVLIAAIVGGPAQLRDELAQFGSPFAYDDDGRFDATMFFVSCIVLMPFVALGVAVVALPIVVLTLETVIFPVSRAAGVSDAVAAVIALGAAFMIVLLRTDIPIWILHGLGTMARAWMVITA